MLSRVGFCNNPWRVAILPSPDHNLRGKLYGFVSTGTAGTRESRRRASWYRSVSRCRQRSRREHSAKDLGRSAEVFDQTTFFISRRERSGSHRRPHFGWMIFHGSLFDGATNSAGNANLPIGGPRIAIQKNGDAGTRLG